MFIRWSPGETAGLVPKTTRWCPALYVPSMSWGLAGCLILSLLSAGHSQPLNPVLVEAGPPRVGRCCGSFWALSRCCLRELRTPVARLHGNLALLSG